MRSCSAPESVRQTQVFSVLLAFLSPHEWLGRSLRAGAEINALKRTKFLHLIVQPEEHPSWAAERFKCKRQRLEPLLNRQTIQLINI